MTRQILAKLSALAPLESVAPGGPPCKICGRETTLFDVVDFNKSCGTDSYRFGIADIAVTYFRCTKCDFIFTNMIDDWEPSEVANFIYNNDYIKVDPEYILARPKRTANIIARFLRGCEHLRVLDYGSGTGKFAEELIRHGYGKVDNYDPFSSPNPPTGEFDIVIMSEVIEHVPDPLETLKSVSRLLSHSGVILIGQTLQPDNINELRGRWWYLAPRNGHVSTFSERTFLIMASKLGLAYHRGPDLYCFARANLHISVATALSAFAVRVQLLSLLAPDENQLCWHHREGTGNRVFRWSRTSEVIWSNVRFPGGTVVVVIPVLMEIWQGFTEQCKMIVDGTPVALSFLHGLMIRAQVNLPAGDHQVRLITPEPVTPRSLRGGPDERSLGLAVPLFSPYS